MKTPHKNPLFPLRLAPEHVAILERLASSLGVSKTDVLRMALIEFGRKIPVAKAKKTA